MSWAAELLNYRNNVLKEQPEPSPLHLVTKIKPMAGRPKNEKLALTSLGFTKEVTVREINFSSGVPLKFLL